jgi:hypothetical protein
MKKSNTPLDLYQQQLNLSKAVSVGLPSFLTGLNSFNNLSGLKSLEMIARSFQSPSIVDTLSKGINAYNLAIGGTATLAKFFSAQSKINNLAISGLSSNMLEITKHNQSLSESLMKSFENQRILFNNISRLSQSIQPALHNYSALSLAVSGFSNNCLNTIIREKQWNDLEVFDEVTVKLNTATIDLTEKNFITEEDLVKYKEEVISEIAALLKKPVSQKVIEFINYFITVISLLFTLYVFHLSKTDITNKDVVRLVHEELERFKIDTQEQIKEGFKNCVPIRFAITTVVLRYSPSQRSLKMGVVQKDQEVFVLGVHHKWLLVSFIDEQTHTPKSGYVFKKYFIPVKQ